MIKKIRERNIFSKRYFFFFFLLLSFVRICSESSYNSQSYEYDLIIIGSGIVGMRAAIKAHDLGKKVLIIEKNKITKTTILSSNLSYIVLGQYAEYMSMRDHLKDFCDMPLTYDLIDQKSFFKCIRKMSLRAYRYMDQKIKDSEKIEQLVAQVKFLDKYTIEANGKKIKARFFLIASGVDIGKPELQGIENVPYYTRENFLNNGTLPASIIIIGRGVFSINLASMLQQLGVQVTLIVENSTLLSFFDYEIVEVLIQLLQQKGIAVYCNMDLSSIEKNNGKVSLFMKNKAQKNYIIEAESIFFHTNLAPNVNGLAIGNAGVVCKKQKNPLPHYYENSYLCKTLEVSPFLQTAQPNIYVAGEASGVDIVGNIGNYQADISVKNMFAKDGLLQAAHYSLMPKSMLIGGVYFSSKGITENEGMRQLDGDSLIYTYEDYFSEKALIKKDFPSIVKFVCTKSGIILGVHAVSYYAKNLIENIQIGYDLGLLHKKFDINLTIFNDCKDMLMFVSKKCANESI